MPEGSILTNFHREVGPYTRTLLECKLLLTIEREGRDQNDAMEG
jgi:hypothetical protein